MIIHWQGISAIQGIHAGAFIWNGIAGYTAPPLSTGRKNFGLLLGVYSG